MARIFGLPHLPENVFNDMAAKLGDTAPVWKDQNGDGQIDPSEIVQNADLYVAGSNGKRSFNMAFEKWYRDAVETYRQQLVKAELAKTYIEPIHTDFEAWLDRVPASVGLTEAEKVAYKHGLAALLKVGPLMHRAYQKQVGYDDALMQKTGTADDQVLTTRYGHPWCLSDQSEFCVALPSLPERTSGILAAGVACADLGQDVSGLANPFTAVVRSDDSGLKAVPYATWFVAEQKQAAEYLRQAAEAFGGIGREKILADYLNKTADAFVSNALFPYVESDAAWMAHGSSNSLLFVRAGADEFGGDGVGDPCGLKARFHLRVGLRDFGAESMRQKYAPHIQQWENEVEELVGNPADYRSTTAAMKMPLFMDTVYESGDDIGGPNGTSVGQTLPNQCGSDGLQEPCPRLTMIYSNKGASAYNRESVARYVAPLFNSRLHGDLLREGSSEATVIHELTHNIGPQPGKPRPGGDVSYDTALGPWKGTFEELKAENGAMYYPSQALYHAREEAAAGRLSAADLDQAEKIYRFEIMRDLAWSIVMVMRATRNGRFEGTTYSRVGAIQLGRLSELGALVWDDATRTWDVNWEKMTEATKTLHTDVLKLYAGGDTAKVDAFVKHYIEGEGFKLLHSDRINEVAGKRPSVLFDYQVNGLQ